MSFDFQPPRRRSAFDSTVPMINVAFLLLAFFLMTSTLAPATPFAVAPPHAAGGLPPEPAPILHVSAAGETGFLDLRGEAALDAFAAAAAASETAGRLRIDGGAEGRAAARILRELAARGLAAVDLAAVDQ